MQEKKNHEIRIRFQKEMEVTIEESFTLPIEIERMGKETNDKDNVPNERLGFQVENLKVQELNQNCEVLKKSKRRGMKRKRRFREFREKLPQSTADMPVSRSCRYKLSVPIWTTIFLVLLARGVNSVSNTQSQFNRLPNYEEDSDVQGGMITPNVQETYYLMQFLRELMQRPQQKMHQQQLQITSNNGKDLNDSQIDWRKVPLPLLHRIRSIISDGSKEEDKRGSYMSLCHFKICNLG